MGYDIVSVVKLSSTILSLFWPTLQRDLDSDLHTNPHPVLSSVQAQDMREQERLRNEMQYQYRLGNMEVGGRFRADNNAGNVCYCRLTCCVEVGVKVEDFLDNQLLAL